MAQNKLGTHLINARTLKGGMRKIYVLGNSNSSLSWKTMARIRIILHPAQNERFAHVIKLNQEFLIFFHSMKEKSK
jgi:hypothetical protein